MRIGSASAQAEEGQWLFKDGVSARRWCLASAAQSSKGSVKEQTQSASFGRSIGSLNADGVGRRAYTQCPQGLRVMSVQC